jgi:hypothetical protein
MINESRRQLTQAVSLAFGNFALRILVWAPAVLTEVLRDFSQVRSESFWNNA